MKSKLIRLVAVVASVLVLAVALAVPMSADYSPETGWDAPVGIIDPIDPLIFFYQDTEGVTHKFTGGLGIPFDIEGRSVNFRYMVIIDIQSDVDYTYNRMSDNVLFAWGFLNSDFDQEFRLSTGFSGNGLGALRFYQYGGGTSKTSIAPVICLFEDYPFTDDVSMLENLSVLDFEVSQVYTAPTAEPIGNVWTEIMTWITSGLNSVQGVFYANNQLTMLGTLAVIGVAIAVAFLLVGVLQRFLHLRG